MKKQRALKILITALWIICAIPLPVSFLSWIFTVVSVLLSGQSDWSSFKTLISYCALFLTNTYIITYLYALFKTNRDQKLSLFSFLPGIHLVIALIFVFLSL